MSQVGMYADTAHFVFELLQNADDAYATEIHFTVRTNELVVEHNGTPFTEENVRAISYFGKGKTDITKIGHFGLGFKSVFAYTSSPKVHSDNESFEITQLYTVAAARHPDDLKPGRTRFVLPFDHLAKNPDYIERRKRKSAEKACEEIGCKLASLGAETLLFTKSLMEIHWATDEEEGHYLREDTPVDKSGREVYIVTGESEVRCYLVFDHPVLWPDENGNEVAHRPVQIAFGLDKGMADGGIIKMIEDARLFVFFPTFKETHVGFILQGPYRTTPARDNVPGDDDFNQHLVKETAALLKDSLPNLKRLGRLNLKTLDTLPINHDRFKEGAFFHPLYASMRDVLANQPLLPTATRGFVGGSQAKLARGADLTKVFGPAQLEHLFGSTGLKWLDPELTQNNYPDLHRFLVGKKAQPVRYFEKAEWIVPPIAEDIEVDAEQIAKRITADFLSQQTDPWMIRFYEYLSGSGHIHFASRPIIRLEDGKHVVPFGKNEVPNAFLPAGDEDEEIVSGLPTVKRSLVQRDEIREFLGEGGLGLTTPDIADLVLKKVLPRYTPVKGEIPIPIWQRHFRQILQALRTDSYEKREMLKTALEDAQFLLAERVGNSEGDVFVRPQDAYLNTEENKLFFSGLDGCISFLAAGYYQDTDIAGLIELGVARSARATGTPSDQQGYVSIYHGHGWHKRGVDGFDPKWNMDGLLYALVAPPSLARSRLIWTYLLPHSQCIRGMIETSSRQTFENAKHENVISDLGKLLMEAPWLPDQQGVFHVPGEIGLNDLADGLDRTSARAKELANKLGMLKSDEQQALAVLTKGDPRRKRIAEYLLHASDDTLDRFDKLIPKEKKPAEFKTFKEGIGAIHRVQRDSTVDTPISAGTVGNAGRYQATLDQETKASVSDAKTHPQSIRFGLVRDNPANAQAREVLYQQYQGKCQVTGRTFVKADGKSYFEAVTLVSRLDAEHLNQPGNMLCLSADTAAKFMHASFVWLDDLQTKIEQFKAEKDGGSEQHRKVRVRLAGHEETITWTEQHFMRLVSLWNNA
jgi:hypothetical protein